MQVLLLESYYGGSHKAWADGYQQHSEHTVTLLTMPAQFWKWRMQGGAISLARMMQERDIRPDVILASDMMDVAAFRALMPAHSRHVPIALYFHETQFTYPQNTRQSHGWRYGFTNYISALAADHVFFNSQYHHDVFFETLPKMLKQFGDYNELQTVDLLHERADVLPLGMDLRRLDAYKPTTGRDPEEPPIILWNHRWEEDKNPQAFLAALDGLIARDVPFQVMITGENPRQTPEEFEQARRKLGDRLIHFGYAADFAEYATLLWQSDYVVSTAYQDFFGSAIAEAIYCGCTPILPDRLNYPYLLPEAGRKSHLYLGKTPLYRLLYHLVDPAPPYCESLRPFIAQFDWQHLAPVYDEALANLTRREVGLRRQQPYSGSASGSGASAGT